MRGCGRPWQVVVFVVVRAWHQPPGDVRPELKGQGCAWVCLVKGLSSTAWMALVGSRWVAGVVGGGGLGPERESAGCRWRLRAVAVGSHVRSLVAGRNGTGLEDVHVRSVRVLSASSGGPGVESRGPGDSTWVQQCMVVAPC